MIKSFEKFIDEGFEVKIFRNFMNDILSIQMRFHKNLSDFWPTIS